MSYGGDDLRRVPLKAGSQAGNVSIRMVLARDGGGVQVSVNDAQNGPVPGASVVLFPADATRIEDLAVGLEGGVTNPSGESRIAMVAPGKYFVLATHSIVDYSPESLQGLLDARGKATEVTIGRGLTPVTIAPVTLR